MMPHDNDSPIERMPSPVERYVPRAKLMRNPRTLLALQKGTEALYEVEQPYGPTVNESTDTVTTPDATGEQATGTQSETPSQE